MKIPVQGRIVTPVAGLPQGGTQSCRPADSDWSSLSGPVRRRPAPFRLSPQRTPALCSRDGTCSAVQPKIAHCIAKRDLRQEPQRVRQIPQKPHVGSKARPVPSSRRPCRHRQRPAYAVPASGSATFGHSLGHSPCDRTRRLRCRHPAFRHGRTRWIELAAVRVHHDALDVTQHSIRGMIMRSGAAYGFS